MQLIAPDILAEARGLTAAMTGTICVLGFALWLFGWRWHRFWIVAGITLAAGLLGLNAGRAAGGTQVMAVGILLAVAAGMLALELAKVFAFVAGGCGAWLAVQWVFPQAQELWAVFLSGGLFGLLLYRLWTMLLTSLAGVLLASHAALCCLKRRPASTRWRGSTPIRRRSMVSRWALSCSASCSRLSPRRTRRRKGIGQGRKGTKGSARDAEEHHEEEGTRGGGSSGDGHIRPEPRSGAQGRWPRPMA